MKYFYRVFLGAAGLLFSVFAQAVEVKNPTCEMLQNPMGIDANQVRFGWQLSSSLQGDKQTNYHILLASSKEKLSKNQGDMWNSLTDSNEEQHPKYGGKSQLIKYTGQTLKPGARYYWKVQVADKNGKFSAWSEVAQFDIAPQINPINLRWIGAIKKADSHLPEGRAYNPPYKKYGYDTLFAKVDTLAKRSILLRKNFTLSKKTIKRAMVYVSGLGHYELSINGKPVGNSKFAPLWSDYEKTIYYNIYDVSTLLQANKNAVGVMLGNGFYNMSENTRYRKLMRTFGPPTLFFRMDVEYNDGTTASIVSDNTWKYALSPITFNSIYGGENYNANLEQKNWNLPTFDDAKWKNAVVQESPVGKLEPQLTPNVKVMNQYDVKRVIEPQKNILVFDMGQNLAGFPTIKVKGKKGQVLRIYPAESLNDDSTVNQKRSGDPYFFEYRLKGDGMEEWTPRFSYYGYQYLQIANVDYKTQKAGSNKPVLLDLKSNFIYSSVVEAGTFECSNEMFNKTHWLINNAIKSNMQAVLTDCPHREKLGWLEQDHLNGPGLYFNYNLSQYMPKVVRDMADAQGKNGLVPNIVPEYTNFSIYSPDFSDSPEWGAAAVIVPWQYYEFYGDSTLIARYFEVMKKYVDYLTSRATNYIVSHGLGDWYDYGEHSAGYSKNSPIALSATSHYYYAAMLTAKAAKMLHSDADEQKYSTLTQNIKWAFNKTFFDIDSKQYGTSSQFSNAVPVFMDIVEPQYKQAVLDNLIKDIQNRGNRLTTGDIGNRYLYQTLARNGYNDVMYTMLNHYDAPGYGMQVKYGVTTLTEQWDPRKGNSWNHFMLGQIEEWFYRTLAGIVPDEKQPGFSHFYISPTPVGDLNYVKASYNSLYGDIKVSWKIENGTFKFQLTVPVNTMATVTLPNVNGAVLVNNMPLAQAKNISTIAANQLLVGSGEYTFTYGEK